MAKDVFMTIGKAEAKVHGKTIEEVHFHEVGAIDSIVDVVGACILIDMLNPDAIYTSRIPFGCGYAKCDHGLMPVPVPATLEILRNYPVKMTNIESELTTPTGAGIVKALSKGTLDASDFEVERIGYGMATKELPIPNMLRIMILSQKKKNLYMK